ncbi:MAG TPA: hypothetical protein VGG32_08510 [Thermoplasmata archaeon]|jgi:hypothetical protein
MNEYRLCRTAVYLLCRWWGFDPDEAVTAVVVAEAASGRDAHFQLVTASDEHTTYRGLFGIEVRDTETVDRMMLFGPTRNVIAAATRFASSGRSWSWHWTSPIENLAELRESVVAELGETYDLDVQAEAVRVEA